MKTNSYLPSMNAERERMFASRLAAAQTQIPQRITNANTKGTYQPPSAYYRNDGLAHIKSRGVSC